ncbi:alpha/beta fold hydrolase [Curvibacter sp. HBC28]|uniref:Alpha/beta fold hydrolase n=1 Tax=Curvibacter microcysteis TaxID=3026419 RepID=A0ABT5MIA3_9BURK|nr:alpha/beta fold hydrolase [Curvibacter sp. HBC28]MDD0815609.1 alpha/beta fold hydrolase [Curvibacter sp. HBC28]
MKIKTKHISLEIRDEGPHDGPVVLLIMGLGMQLVAWPASLVDGLVNAGHRVIRFDNRDIGLSQHFDELGVPHLPWHLLRHALCMPARPPYRLQDMAQDGLDLLDALQIERAHVLGVSMGGMIAQRMAISAPLRLRSLTSVMSSSGARGLPGPSAAARAALLRRPSGDTDSVLHHYLQLYRLIGSPAFQDDPEALRRRILAGIHRSYHPEGTVRQMAAIVADSGRAKALARISTPTLVVHGRQDPLVPLACGQDTAARIPGARMAVIDGMGHDLPEGVVQRLLPLVLPHLAAH